MILTGETCEVLKTSQVFGEPAHHIHCVCVVEALPVVSDRNDSDSRSARLCLV